MCTHMGCTMGAHGSCYGCQVSRTLWERMMDRRRPYRDVGGVEKAMLSEHGRIAEVVISGTAATICSNNTSTSPRLRSGDSTISASDQQSAQCKMPVRMASSIWTTFSSSGILKDPHNWQALLRASDSSTPPSLILLLRTPRIPRRNH